MIRVDAVAVRRKMMGIALRGARLAQGRSLDDCAQILHCSADRISEYERGESDISLPELETLARFLQTSPLDILAGKMPAKPESISTRSPQAFLLRRKIIGALMRKARQEAGRTIEEVASQIGCSPEALSDYERGQADIPALRLQALAEYLGVPFAQFLESPPRPEEKPVAKSPDTWDRLPSEVKEFLAAPYHIPYVKIAMELSRLSPQGLRAIAEAILAAQSVE